MMNRMMKAEVIFTAQALDCVCVILRAAEAGYGGHGNPDSCFRQH